MLTVIHQFEQIVAQAKKLPFGAEKEAQVLQKEALTIQQTHLPRHKKLEATLQEIQFDQTESDNWPDLQQQFLQTLNQIQIKLQQKASVTNKENIEQAIRTQQELEKLKNDYEKDLILEKNNYEFLKKKYELLQYNHDQLKRNLQKAVLTKNNWIRFFTFSLPVVFFVLVFDHFIHLEWLENLKLINTFKIMASFAIVSILLFFTLRSFRFLVIALGFILVMVILGLLI
ncbi:MAG: hypothetical protein ACNS62_12670 [Candidatus Cyclobacteriaceae bacterium M3_2C_046]